MVSVTIESLSDNSIMARPVQSLSVSLPHNYPAASIIQLESCPSCNIYIRHVFTTQSYMYRHTHVHICGKELHPRYATRRELYECHLDIARLLLCWGADASIVDASGATAHDLAVQSNSSELINMTNTIFGMCNSKKKKKLLIVCGITCR